mgnify:FL=1
MDEASLVGYDVIRNTLFVDRTQSGDVAFHEDFGGKHEGPLAIENGHIHLQIFLDDSSIEVFGNLGETVLSERIFPSPDNISVEYFSKGGDSKISSLRAWNLQSIWHP